MIGSQPRIRMVGNTALPQAASDPRVARVLLRMAPEMRASFSSEQMAAICEAVVPQSTTADVHDVRLSIRAFRANYFLRILWGPERRSQKRLQQEGQYKFGRSLLVFLLICWTVTTFAVIVLAALLYFYKSYVGIEFFPGPSIVDRCLGW